MRTDLQAEVERNWNRIYFKSLSYLKSLYIKNQIQKYFDFIDKTHLNAQQFGFNFTLNTRKMVFLRDDKGSKRIL